MALFRPITTPDDLPAIGTSRESGTFDFKEEPTSPVQRELAKDVAAFANALGGVILVGTFEDKKRGTLGKYKPIARLETAESLKTAYELAVSQRCLPQPVIDVVRIETDAAPAVGAPGHVVAVNVYAMPMGPVGVRWDGDNAYAFPLRTATQTHWMKPTELAMLMVPDIRRAAILLDSIPIDQRHGIHLLYGDRNNPIAIVVTVKEIDPALTSFTVKVTDEASMKGNVVTIPVDCVRSVWRRFGSYWNIAVAGSFAQDRDRGLIFFPG